MPVYRPRPVVASGPMGHATALARVKRSPAFQFRKLVQHVKAMLHIGRKPCGPVSECSRHHVATEVKRIKRIERKVQPKQKIHEIVNVHSAPAEVEWDMLEDFVFETKASHPSVCVRVEVTKLDQQISGTSKVEAPNEEHEHLVVEEGVNEEPKEVEVMETSQNDLVRPCPAAIISQPLPPWIPGPEWVARRSSNPRRVAEDSAPSSAPSNSFVCPCHADGTYPLLPWIPGPEWVARRSPLPPIPASVQPPSGVESEVQGESLSDAGRGVDIVVEQFTLLGDVSEEDEFWGCPCSPGQELRI